MMDNNLSDVSDNISQCLNESDFHMNEDKMLVNSAYEDSIQEKLDLPNTFTKKPADKFDESLNYT